MSGHADAPRRRGRRRAEDGMSLVEVMVAMSLMVAIVPIFVPLLLSATKSARSLGFQSQTLDELRLAVATIGRELRSAQCISLPVANEAAGPTLQFSTDAFLTGAPDTTYQVTYTAQDGRLLRDAAGRSTVAATGLVRFSDAFQQQVTPRRSVKLVFRIQSHPDTPEREVSTTIAGRNAWRDC